jgi:hypothetical protein
MKKSPKDNQNKSDFLTMIKTCHPFNYVWDMHTHELYVKDTYATWIVYTFQFLFQVTNE